MQAGAGGTHVGPLTLLAPPLLCGAVLCCAALPCLPAGSRDGVLRWFEAYAAALSSGRFAVEQLQEEYPKSLGISLFPQLPPWRAEAVTEVGWGVGAVDVLRLAGAAAGRPRGAQRAHLEAQTAPPPVERGR